MGAIGIANECTLINTIFCKPDDGRTRPKHVAYLTSCRFATLIFMLCKDGST